MKARFDDGQERVPKSVKLMNNWNMVGFRV